MIAKRQRWLTLLLGMTAAGLLLFGAVGSALATGGDDGTLTVLKGGYRDTMDDSSKSFAKGVEGAQFEYAPTDTFAGATAFPLTDATGAATSGVLSSGKQYVRETSAPSGWRMLEQLNFGGGPEPYIGSAYIDGNRTVTPRFVNAADNPPLPTSCGTGLKVLLVMDNSGSTSSYKADYIKAGHTFVDTLAGTPTQLMISSFSTTSAPGSATYDLTASGGAGQIDANKQIDYLYGAGFANGLTNWDAAMQDAAKAGVDVVVFVTDGNPTVRVGGDGSVENVVYGVASANLAKWPAMDQSKTGQRIIGVGVGGGISVDNLQAISGPVADEDYFLGSESGLAKKLAEVAGTLCPGTIDLRKVVVNGIDGQTFNMLIDGQIVGSPIGNDESTGPQSVPAGLHVVSETGAAGVDLAEYQSEVGCVEIGAPTKAILLDTVPGTSTEIKVGSNQDIECTFTNTFDPAMLTLVKNVTNDNGGTAGAGDFTLAATAQAGSDSTRDFTSATVDPIGHPVFGGVAYDLSETGPAGYAAGDWSCEVTNDQAALRGKQLDLVGSTVTLQIGEHVTCSITNDDVAPVLQLRKTVVNDNGGTATAADFTLSATGTLAGNSLTGVTPIDSGATLQADTWTLSESGPSGYTGTWVCIGGTQVGSTVAVGIGGTATCTIVNDDIAPAVVPVVAPPAAATPVVAPPATTRGTATLRGPEGCLAGTQALTRVSGRNVARVLFYRDGRLVKRVTATGKGLEVFTLRTVLRESQLGVHTVTARVVFVSGATPKAKTLTHRFALCRVLPPVTG